MTKSTLILITLLNGIFVAITMSHTSARAVLLNKQNKNLRVKLAKAQTNYRQQLKKLVEIENKYSDLQSLHKHYKTKLKERKQEAKGLSKKVSIRKQRRLDIERKLKKAEKKISDLKSEILKTRIDQSKINAYLKQMAIQLQEQDDYKRNFLNKLHDIFIKNRLPGHASFFINN